MKTLTIAIPTYNRSSKLSDTLHSIVSQEGFDVNRLKVLISDNCSTDDTFDVILYFQKNYNLQIHYYKNEINKGIDYNIYKCVELSTTDFVYLLSDDDILLENSISYMFDLIDNHKDISFFYINGIGFEFDKDKNKVFYKTAVMDANNNIIFSDKNDFVSFIGLQVTFISAFLLNREIWNKNIDKDRFIGTDIYLSYDLFYLLANSNKYMFVKKPLVGVHNSYTVGNYRIFYAFAYQWRKLLLDEAPQIGFEYSKMRKIFDSNLRHLGGRIKTIKRGGINISLDWESIKYIVVSTYDTKIFWFHLLPAILKPKFLYKLEVYLKVLRNHIRNYLN